MNAILHDTSSATPAPERDDHGRGNALAWFASIVEMVDQLRAANRHAIDTPPTADGNYDEENDNARQRITESVLSVEVRSGWYAASGNGLDSAAPAEFRILLTTGGPAAQLCGTLSEHGEPESARLEFQDWGTPWAEIPVRELALQMASNDPKLDYANDAVAAYETVKAYLLEFARQFYFGEG